MNGGLLSGKVNELLSKWVVGELFHFSPERLLKSFCASDCLLPWKLRFDCVLTKD